MYLILISPPSFQISLILSKLIVLSLKQYISSLQISITTTKVSFLFYFSCHKNWAINIFTVFKSSIYNSHKCTANKSFYFAPFLQFSKIVIEGYKCIKLGVTDKNTKSSGIYKSFLCTLRFKYLEN